MQQMAHCNVEFRLKAPNLRNLLMAEHGFLAFIGDGEFRRVGDMKESEGRTLGLCVGSRDSRMLLFRRGMPLADGHGGLFLLPGDAPAAAAFQRAGSGECVLAGLLGELPVFALEVGASIAGGRTDEHEPFDRSTHSHAALPDESRFENLRILMGGLPPTQAELAATAKSLLSWHRNSRFCGRCGGATRAAWNGWQRSCGACRTTEFPRTNPVVIMLVEWRDRLLVGRSYHWPERMYSLLAGFIEPGESVEAAVRRETREETGVEVGEVRYVGSQPWPFPASLMIGCRAAALGCQVRTNRAEIEHARWLGRDDVLALLSGDLETMRPPANGSIARYLMCNWLMDSLR